MACGSCGQRYRAVKTVTIPQPSQKRGIVQNTEPKAGRTPHVQQQQNAPVASENNLPPKNPTTGIAESVITTGKQGPEIPPNSTGIDGGAGEG